MSAMICRDTPKEWDGCSTEQCLLEALRENVLLGTVRVLVQKAELSWHLPATYITVQKLCCHTN